MYIVSNIVKNECVSFLKTLAYTYSTTAYRAPQNNFFMNVVTNRPKSTNRRQTDARIDCAQKLNSLNVDVYDGGMPDLPTRLFDISHTYGIRVYHVEYVATCLLAYCTPVHTLSRTQWLLVITQCYSITLPVFLVGIHQFGST